MEFVYEQKLQNYMLQKGKKNIVVEEITSNNSDFEITELHIHLIDDRQAEFFKTKKSYYAKNTEMGQVLLPPFQLKYDDVITFGLKSFLGIKYVTCKGIQK
ncbi:MAG: hypothetical protein KIH00_13635 [Lachnospiraceae bacterium]|nr:hypothetical protein [Lachnospiraceae bacterium]MDY5869110.1 hypothetical protein [Lachnospiraceae bacterium]